MSSNETVIKKLIQDQNGPDQAYYFHKHNFLKFQSDSSKSMASQESKPHAVQTKGLSKIKTSPLHCHLQQNNIVSSGPQDQSNDTDQRDCKLDKSKSFNTKKTARDSETKTFSRTKSYSKSKRDAIANNKNVMKIINDSLKTDANVCDVLWLPAIKLKNSAVKNKDLRLACVGSMDILYPTTYKNGSYISTTSDSCADQQERFKPKKLENNKKERQLIKIDETRSNSTDKELIVPPKRWKLKQKKEKNPDLKPNDQLERQSSTEKTLTTPTSNNEEQNVHLKNIISQAAGDLTQLILPIIKLAGLSGGVNGEKYQNLLTAYKDVQVKSKQLGDCANNRTASNNVATFTGLDHKVSLRKPTQPPPQPPPRFLSLPFRKKASERTPPPVPPTLPPPPPPPDRTSQSQTNRISDNQSHIESTRTAKSSLSSEPNQFKLESLKYEIDKTMNELTQFQHEVTNRIQNSSTTSTLTHHATTINSPANLNNRKQFDTGVNTDISMCNAVFTIKYDNGSDTPTSSSVNSDTRKPSDAQTTHNRLSTPSVLSAQSLPYMTSTLNNKRLTQDHDQVNGDENMVTADVLRKRLENELSKKYKFDNTTRSATDTPTLKRNNEHCVDDGLKTPRTSQTTPSTTKDDSTIILSFIPLKRNNQSRRSLPITCNDCCKSNTSIDSNQVLRPTTMVYGPRVVRTVSVANQTKQPSNLIKIKDCRFNRAKNSYQTYPTKTPAKQKAHVKSNVLPSYTTIANPKSNMTTINYVTSDELDKKIYRYPERPKSSVDMLGSGKQEKVIDEMDVHMVAQQHCNQPKTKVYNLKYYLNGINSQYRSLNRSDYKIRYPLDEIEEQIEELLVNKSNDRLNNLKVKYMKNKIDESGVKSSMKPMRFIYKVGDTDDDDCSTDNKNNISDLSAKPEPVLLSNTNKLNQIRQLNDFDKKLIEIN